MYSSKVIERQYWGAKLDPTTLEPRSSKDKYDVHPKSDIQSTKESSDGRLRALRAGIESSRISTMKLDSGPSCAIALNTKLSEFF